jgi:hypothetical protein
VVGRSGDPNRILQAPTIAPIALSLEGQAIAAVLQQYRLPESERERVLRFARNQVRAALFGHLIEAFRKEPGSRSAAERAVVEAFTRLVREKHVEAATSAQNWYRIWEANPCGFEPPAGFTYSRPTACASPLAGALALPSPPSYEAFQAYGAATAYKTAQDDPEIARVYSATSMGALAGYGLATALGAGVVGASVGSMMALGTFSAIFPFAATTAGLSFLGALPASGGLTELLAATGATTGFGASAEATSIGGSTAAGVWGASAAGGVAAIVIAAVVIGVLQGIQVFEDAAIPGKLQEALDAARSYDVGAAIRSDNSETSKAAQTELFAEFITTTLPDRPGTDPAPAGQPGDPRLVVQGRPVDWLQYTAADGSQRAVRLSGRWFADRAGSAGDGAARLTLTITYRDAAGAAWTAARVGNQFVLVRVGDPAAADYPAPRPAAELPVVDWGGHAVTARVGG